MKIRWRQQEIVFVISTFVLLLIDNLMSADIEKGAMLMNGRAYIAESNHTVTFLLLYAVPLVLLLVINGYVFPRYKMHKNRGWIFTGVFFFFWIILIFSFSLHY
ncbi:MAG: hypothetical protein J7527_12945, partial [Chitinophagaceae bacterium]|nr:hypothetical protein [Chitinophagaceae bacterium]